MQLYSPLRTFLLSTLFSTSAFVSAQDLEEIQKELDRLRAEIRQLEINQQSDRVITGAGDEVLSDHPADWPNAVTEGLVIARDKSFELVIGGYVRLDLLYTPRAIGDEESWSTATIPVRSSRDGEWYLNTQKGFVEADNQFRFNVKQTRINLESKTQTDAGQLKVFIETDFWGTGQLRLRHAYAEFTDWKVGGVHGDWLVGQTWSSFAATNSWVDVLDFQGPNANTTMRLPMVRWRQFVSDSFVYTLSLEQNPYDVATTDVYVDGARVMPKKFTGTYPMVVAAFELGSKDLNVQFSAAYATIQADMTYDIVNQDPFVRQEQINGLAFNIGGNINLTERDALKYYVVFSDGLGDVIADLNTGYANGVYGLTDKNRIQQLRSYGAQLGYEHQWTDTTKSSAVWSYVNVDNTDKQEFMSFHESHYGAVNYLWSPIRQMMVGAELQYGFRQNKGGDHNDAWRLQFSTQYNF